MCEKEKAAMAPSPQDKSPIMNGTPPVNASTKASPLQIILLLLTFLTGSLLGGYVTSSLLETEYQSILSSLRSNHQLSSSETRQQYQSCHAELTEEKKAHSASIANADDGCRDELKAVKSQWRHEELICQQELEREILWSHKAYEDGTRAITAATDKLEALKQQRIEMEQKLDTQQKELQQVTSNLQLTTNEKEQAQHRLESFLPQFNEVTAELEQLQSFISAIEAEMERRDIERAECDALHRELDTCRSSLEQSLEGSIDGCQTSMELLKTEKMELARMVSTLETKMNKVSEEKNVLDRRVDHLEGQLGGANALVGEFEVERDGLRSQLDLIERRMKERDQLRVLHK
jgi:chromosome segregation ATPase